MFVASTDVFEGPAFVDAERWLWKSFPSHFTGFNRPMVHLECHPRLGDKDLHGD